jgi:hypothetical protein
VGDWALKIHKVPLKGSSPGISGTKKTNFISKVAVYFIPSLKVYTVKKVIDFLVPSRDVTYPGGE